ncbi:MAG: DUF6748 domain-containing protein [Acidobacteriota bacterium]
MRHVQKITFVAVIAILSCAVGMWPPTSGSSHPPEPEQLSANSSGTESLTPQPFAGSGDYFLIRQDRRRCISPLCGGYFVKRVNQSRTRCANGRWMRECYVAEIDWKGQPEVDPGKALVRGEIVARRFARFGNLGALSVTELWQSPSDKPATGTIYRARDRGVRCITHPCLSHTATRLNFNVTTKVAGVDLAAADDDGSEAAAAMTQPEGIMVAGYFSPVRGPAGRAQILKATKFYLRSGSEVGGPAPGARRCFKTGCSSEVCSDREVVTACIFRPEFACYQKATCTRQRNGECGFTQTAELAACLARARR